MDPRNSDASDVHYLAKCANNTEQTRTAVAIANEYGDKNQRGNTLIRSRLVKGEKREEEEEEEENKDEVVGLQLPFATSGDESEMAPPSQMRCNCYDTKCEIKQYLQQARLKRHLERPPRLRASVVDAFCRLHGASSYSDLLLAAQRRLLSKAGGPAAVSAVYESCLGLHNRDAQVLSDAWTEAGDTRLMMLCGTAPCGDTDSSGADVLLGQIMAFIRLYLEFKPELLFVRNNEGSNALVLAALSNKTAVATYLALLYADLGRDPNEADATHGGHTVLHVMARKGDDCADTLEELLKLGRMEDNPSANTSAAAPLSSSSPSSGRLLRLDVVNDGGKTPLDVATACREIFSTGSGRTIYTQVIQAFHDVIEEDAREITMHMGMEDATNEKTRRQTKTPYVPMTFRNF